VSGFRVGLNSWLTVSRLVALRKASRQWSGHEGGRKNDIRIVLGLRGRDLYVRVLQVKISGLNVIETYAIYSEDCLHQALYRPSQWSSHEGGSEERCPAGFGVFDQRRPRPGVYKFTDFAQNQGSS
jgi:hypothetical protein